jgi:glucosamine-6-phosphate deaminase
MDRILGAREVWLLVTGERKARILRRALRDPEGPDCPASFLRRHSNLSTFADEQAAALLA